MVGSLVAASRGPLISCIVDDLGRPDNSERIGSGFRDRSEDAARTNRRNSSEHSLVRAFTRPSNHQSEQSIRPSNQFVRAINSSEQSICPSNQSAECNQSLLPMQKSSWHQRSARRLARFLMSGKSTDLGVRRWPTNGYDSPRSRGCLTTSRARNRDLRCNRWFVGFR